jgi:DNA-binding HxlR family transcriptional regulator
MTKLNPKRTGCPISSSLDFFGDKWTLIIIRDLLAGKNRYSQFQDSPEGIPTNILASRLKRLEEIDVVTRHQYSDHARRFEYRLTPRGKDLRPVLQEMAKWGQAHVQDAWEPGDWFWAEA